MRDSLVARSIARIPAVPVLTIGAILMSVGASVAAPPADNPPVRVNETIVKPDPDAGDANFRKGNPGTIDPRIAAMEARFKTRKIVRDPNVPPQINSVDIGNLAVIEDDGTLILPNGPDFVTDTVAILDAFFTTHTDVYDGVVIFTASNFPGNVDPEAGFAFYSGRASYAAGLNKTLGVSTFSDTNGITRLLGVMNMNDIPAYPASPSTDFFGGGVASGVEIMGQEWAHGFGAFVQADTADILGRGNSHWSFFLSHPGGIGNASPVEGNIWQDNLDGTFTTIDSFSGHSPLDDYLYGLRTPATVPPFFLINSTDFPDSKFPALGVTVNGTRTDLTINNILNLNGPRMPDTTTSMKSTRLAFVLVIPQGTTATASDLNFMSLFSSQWINYYQTTTDNLGTMDMSLGLPVGSPLPFADTFDVGPDVDLNNWTYHQGTIVDNLGVNEPTGNSSLHMDGEWGGADELRSRTIDLSAQAAGTVSADYSVQRGGNSVAPIAGQNLTIEYFNNANVWLTLRTIVGSGASDPSFVAFSDALPADAMHDRFRLRFRRERIALLGTDSGAYFVDDVSLAIGAGCVVDLNGDGFVDAADLASLLAQWGTAGSADFNGDGAVDAADLAALLSNWGPCP